MPDRHMMTETAVRRSGRRNDRSITMPTPRHANPGETINRAGTIGKVD